MSRNDIRGTLTRSVHKELAVVVRLLLVSDLVRKAIFL